MVSSHKSYVGKCYCGEETLNFSMTPKMKKYYKIISERASNQYEMSALIFYEHPFYWFDYQDHKFGLPGNWYLGNYVFDGIQVENFGAFCVSNRINNNIFDLTPISLDEYNAAMDKYIEELQNMEWPADHYRFGNKLPSDPDWKRGD